MWPKNSLQGVGEQLMAPDAYLKRHAALDGHSRSQVQAFSSRDELAKRGQNASPTSPLESWATTRAAAFYLKCAMMTLDGAALAQAVSRKRRALERCTGGCLCESITPTELMDGD